jgi:transposase
MKRSAACLLFLGLLALGLSRLIGEGARAQQTETVHLVSGCQIRSLAAYPTGTPLPDIAADISAGNPTFWFLIAGGPFQAFDARFPEASDKLELRPDDEAAFICLEAEALWTRPAGPARTGTVDLVPGCQLTSLASYPTGTLLANIAADISAGNPTFWFLIPGAPFQAFDARFPEASDKTQLGADDEAAFLCMDAPAQWARGGATPAAAPPTPLPAWSMTVYNAAPYPIMVEIISIGGRSAVEVPACPTCGVVPEESVSDNDEREAACRRGSAVSASTFEFGYVVARSESPPLVLGPASFFTGAQFACVLESSSGPRLITHHRTESGTWSLILPAPEGPPPTGPVPVTVFNATVLPMSITLTGATQSETVTLGSCNGCGPITLTPGSPGTPSLGIPPLPPQLPSAAQVREICSAGTHTSLQVASDIYEVGSGSSDGGVVLKPILLVALRADDDVALCLASVIEGTKQSFAVIGLFDSGSYFETQ